MYHVLFVFFLAVFFFVAPSLVLAQTPTCTIIYGGGEIDCEATASATTKPTTKPTATSTPSKPATESEQTPSTGSGQATKGGLPVHEPTNATKTPDTGPEMLSLAALIPAAAAGLYLRRKTK